VATFPEIMYSQPSFLQSSTMATLMSSAKTLASGWSLYQSVSNLTHSWGGSSQLAQAGQATTLMSSGQQVLTSITQTQTQLNSAATQMHAAKTRLTTLVTAARAEGFIVLPTGQVILSPAQASSTWGVAYFKARAVVYNAQIQAVVATTTASDLQNGLALAKTGVDILSAIMNRNGTAQNPALATVDPNTLTGNTIGASTLPADQIGVGSGLAGVGVGDLRGITSDGGLGGLGGIPLSGSGLGPAGGPGLGLTGASGSIGNLGGALVAGQGIGAGQAIGAGSRLGGGPGVVGGSAGSGAAGAGTGAAGEPVGGRAGAAGSTSMIGMGGAPARGATMSDEEREARGWLLAEDEDAWTPANVADTTNGVIS
jgi:hypothetical protein